MWLLTLPVVSYLLLLAHFLRDDQWLLMVPALAAMAMLGVPRPWAAHLVRVSMFAASLVWLYSLVGMATMRWTMDMPFLRLSVILSSVIVLTIASIFVFAHPRLRRYYRLGCQ